MHFARVICLALVLLDAPSKAAEAPPANVSGARLLNFDSPARIPGRYMVRFKSEARLHELSSSALRNVESPNVLPISSEETIELARGLARRARATLTHTFRNSAKGFALRDVTEQALKDLAQDPRVDYIEPVVKMQALTTQGTPSHPAPWHLDRIDQRLLPLDSTYTYNLNGNNVTVYVLDTGVWYTHNEFQNRAGSYVWDCVVPSGFQQSCRTRRAADGYNIDCTGHGTQVAGIIGSATYGIAKGVDLQAMIVTHSANDGLNCSDDGDAADQVSAFDLVEDFAQNASRTLVVNYSIGSTSIVNSLEDAIRGAVNDGVVVVVAAGNNGVNACNSTPSRMPEVITVGATTDSDSKWSLSDFGPCVDVFAPGVNLITTDRGSNSAIAAAVAGTSAAAPVVAGVAALYLQLYPTASPSEVRSAIVAGATGGVLTSVGTGSPNLLVHVGGTIGEPPPGAISEQRLRTVISIIGAFLSN